MEKYFRSVKYGALCLLLAVSLSAQAGHGKIPRKLLRDSLPVLTERCAEVFEGAYMAQKHLGTNKKLKGWEGYPVELYEYYTGYDSTACGPKKGKVYMLNPSPEKLARWIMTACWAASGTLKYEYTERIRQYIIHQSGAQFPVSGVVYEAMYKPGDYYPYLFKDGVTVYLSDSTYFARDKHPGEEMLDFYLTMDYGDLRPVTGRYARICSTTREQYLSAGGKEDVGTSEDRRQHWLEVVRELYKKAWKSDENELITAWAKAYIPGTPGDLDWAGIK